MLGPLRHADEVMNRDGRRCRLFCGSDKARHQPQKSGQPHSRRNPQHRAIARLQQIKIQILMNRRLSCRCDFPNDQQQQKRHTVRTVSVKLPAARRARVVPMAGRAAVARLSSRLMSLNLAIRFTTDLLRPQSDHRRRARSQTTDFSRADMLMRVAVSHVYELSRCDHGR